MSEKTVQEKLMLKPGQTFLLLNPPKGYEKSLGAIAKGVKLTTAITSEKVDVIQVFVSSRKELQDSLLRLKKLINPAGLIWVTYPKGTSGIKTDINPIQSEHTPRPWDWKPSQSSRWMATGQR